jgi:endoglucanase
VYIKESEEWLTFLEQRGISWANWSLCDKNETSAALKSGTSAENWTKDNLTESGLFVFEHFK